MGRRFVLASASPARLRVLRGAGMDPEVVVSGVDESDVEPADIRATVLLLAARKADAVAAVPEVAGALVLGCDSMFELDGEVRGKPVDAAEAKRWGRRMRGREGTLFTGHCLIDTATGKRLSDVATTTVRFGCPTDAEIDAYVATGEPLAVAGGFTLDGLSASFIDGVDGDPGNVIGVSLPLLRQMLAGLDIEVTALWR
jgi:septum formation protein